MPHFWSKQLHAVTHNRTVRRSGLVIGSLFLLYGLFGYLALPVIIKSQTRTLIAEKLHRSSTIDAVDVNPFALTVTMHKLRLMEPEGNAVFASFNTLSLNLSLESVLRLAPVIQEVRLTSPYVHLVRKDAHRYNIDDLIDLIANRPSSPQPARFSVNNIQVEDGRIEFQDKPEKASHAVTGLSLGIPFVSSLPSQVNVFVEPLLRAMVDGTPLLISGKARPFAETRDAALELNLNGLDLTRYVDYLPFEPRFKVVAARLDTHLTLTFQQPRDKAPVFMLGGSASIKSTQLTESDGRPLLKLPELVVSLDNTDLLSGRIELAKVVLNGLSAEVSRERDGGLNLMRLLPAPAQKAVQMPKRAAPSAPLHIAVGEVAVRNGTLHYTDEQAARPLVAGLEKFDATVRKLAVDTGKRTVNIGEVASGRAGVFLRHGKPGGVAAPAEPVPPSTKAHHVAAVRPADAPYVLRVERVRIENWSARLEDQGLPQPAVTQVAPLGVSIDGLSTASAGTARVALKAVVNKSGQLSLNGSLGLVPLRTDLAVDLKSVDILPLQPLVADKINLQFTSANLSTKGKLQLVAGEDGALKGGYKGDAELTNLATVDKAAGNDFLRWKSLLFRGADVQLQPLAVTVDNVALTDFFARVSIDPKGRINLQDIVHSDAGGQKIPNGAGVTPPVPGPATTSTIPRAAVASAATRRAVPPVSIRKLTLQGGRVRFSDNFVKPNYSASLTDIGGVVSGLSSDATASASVDLHGEVNRAPLSIAGRINPLRRDLFLDLKANVRGMELAALSPYADKYIGYGIEKGKLSFEVIYHVENRQLSAANRLILDQLTLGEQSNNSATSKLPVKLAIALLQDRNGIIDVNVPIDGSLDDPQFSLGGIVLKVIGNAIVKAVTRPFAALASIFGGSGSAQLSSLSFEPGRATIAPAGEATLDSLAKALNNRPALKLEITGWADPATDREGLKRVYMERKMRALKTNDLRSQGQLADSGSVTVTASDYPGLLARVYDAEKFAKPRNLIGLQKRLPPADMERLIMANTPIDEDDLYSLANRRAQATKDWLLKFGHVPGERVFLLAPESGGHEAKEGGVAAPSSKVVFSLQ